MRQAELSTVGEVGMASHPREKGAPEWKEDDDLAHPLSLRRYEVDLAHRSGLRHPSAPAGELALRMSGTRSNPPDQNVRRTVTKLALSLAAAR